MVMLLTETVVFAYIFSLYFFSYRQGTNIISNAIAIAVMAFIAANPQHGLFCIFKGRRFCRPLFRNCLLVSFFCFTAVAGASYFVALDKALALKTIKTLVSILVFISIFSLHINHRHTTERIISYILYSGLFASLYILANYSRAGSIRLGAVLGNQNNMAMIIGSSLIFAYYRVLFEKKYSCILYGLPMSVFIVLSGSRRAVIFVVTGIAVMTFLKYRKDYKKLLKFGAAGLAMLVLFYILTMNVPMLYKIIGIRFEHVFDFIAGRPITNEQSIPKREYMFRLGLEMFAEKPVLGHGINNYRVMLEQKKGWHTYSHNNFIEIIFGTGLLGALTYYSMFVVLLWKLRKLKNKQQYLFMSWLIASLAVEGITVQYYSKLFYIILALSAAAAHTSKYTGKALGIISETLEKGGAEKTAANLSLYLPDSYEKKLLLYDASKVVYTYGGSILDMKSPGSGRLLTKGAAFLKRIYTVNALKEKYRFHAVISLMDSCNIINILTRQDEKVVVSARNELFIKEKDIYHKIRKQLLKWLYNDADNIVAVSEGIRSELIKKYRVRKDKVKVIYNGYNLKKIRALMQEETEQQYRELFESPCIITAGRLTRQKGQWHLIRAFQKVKETVPDAKLIIMGKGELDEELRQLSDHLGFREDVHFIGFQENPYKYIAKANVFVLPSMYEGFPNALAEAMACGIPVISSDCRTGPREILAPMTNPEQQTAGIEEAPYGILVPVCSGRHLSWSETLEEEEKLLAEAAIKLLTNERLRQHYAVMARKRIEDFEMEKMINQWKETIQ